MELLGYTRSYLDYTAYMLGRCKPEMAKMNLASACYAYEAQIASVATCLKHGAGTSEYISLLLFFPTCCTL